MGSDSAVPASEKEYLREPAKKPLDYSRLPVMAERKRLWYLHNRLAGVRPMVVMEGDTFITDILPPSRCEHPLAARAERQFLRPIAAYVKKTAATTKGRCRAEFIFRDIYTLHGNLAKTRRAVEITRRIAENIYR